MDKNEYTAIWNGHAGRAWVEAQELLDDTLRPFEHLLAPAAGGNRVLDVGCGTGAVTLALARTGNATGIDISEPMVAAARARAEQEGVRARFICADAQDHDFEPGSFDTIVSRFGVMFFRDSVAAFANLRRAARNGANLRFVAWRSPDENPFMTAAERAAAPLLPNLPRRRPDAPGQFAFADAQRVRGILEDSSWTAIDIRPLDVACSLPEKDLDHYLTRLGPVGTALQEADEPTRRHVIGALRTAFDPYVDGNVVRYTAACWLVDAETA